MVGEDRGPQSRSASNQAAYEVAEYMMKLRAAVTQLAGEGMAGERTASELTEAVGKDTAELVEAGDKDYWNTRTRPALLKSGG